MYGRLLRAWVPIVLSSTFHKLPRLPGASKMFSQGLFQAWFPQSLSVMRTEYTAFEPSQLGASSNPVQRLQSSFLAEHFNIARVLLHAPNVCAYELNEELKKCLLGSAVCYKRTFGATPNTKSLRTSATVSTFETTTLAQETTRYKYLGRYRGTEYTVAVVVERAPLVLGVSDE